MKSWIQEMRENILFNHESFLSSGKFIWADVHKVFPTDTI